VKSEPLLRIENVSKSYYRIEALKDITFDIHKGEILGLLGANGAGKSTLLKIIGGVENADEGHVFLGDEDLNHINPHEAQEKGVISVYQELNLFQNLNVVENLFIGREKKTPIGMVNWKSARLQAKEILESLDLDIPIDAVVSSLSVAQQHVLEIARALSENPKLLLLDEPTSALSEKEIEWLFSIIKNRAKQGTTVIYVSHRLDEVTELCEHCVVLRDGLLAKNFDGAFDKASIINSMIGHDVTLVRDAGKVNTNEIIYECRNVYQKNRVKDISFNVRRGEILGIAGLVGAGRTELLRTLFGVDKMTSGEVFVRGKKVRIRNPKDAMSHGITLIPEDRKLEGLFLEENLRFNVSVATLKKRTAAGFIKEKDEKKVVRQAAESVQIDTTRIEDFVKLLSGGNQQKAVIAKTLLVNADVLLLDEPTRGVDIGAREEIYEIIKGFAKNGKSIVLVSSDWEELLYISDRLIVMAEGKMTGELSAEGASEEELLHLSTPAGISGTEERIRGTATDEKKLPSIFRGRKTAAERSPGYFQKFLALYRKNNNAILLSILAALFIFGAIAEPAFISWFNIRNMMVQMMPYLILTIGQLIVIISGGLDLSSGALLATSSVLGVRIMLLNPPGVLLGVAVMVVFGLAVGAVNALLVVKARVDSFVTTLGMSIILTGITLVITKNPIGPAPKVIRQIVNNAVGGVPYVLFIIVALIAVFTIILRFTALGRQFYAVGENAKGAYWAGLPVQKAKFMAFMISSFMAVLAGIFMQGRTGAADPAFGPGMEIIAIAAALIGGAVLGGGRGTLSGAIFGVLFLVFLENILSLKEVELWYQHVIEGVLLLLIIISYEIKVMRSRQ
jgi:ABC-type sugar transport system ATPase subunit/ribose/xylose/arabinose/galactoside ABC-type transport system permease subunit